MVSKFVPKSLKAKIKRLYKRLQYFGLNYYCPVCRSHLRTLLPYGIKELINVRCPVCNLLERHRFVWLFFHYHTNLFDGLSKKILHIAPEPEFAIHFQKTRGIDYLSGDLNSPRAMVKMDITDIQYEDGAFDVIYCSHVLEHVPDDRKAIKELYRVLKAGGWALIVVPLNVEKTFENPSITDPAERERLFGQHDHVRKYGHDFEGRLKKVGFVVKKVFPGDFLSESQIKAYALNYTTKKHTPIFFCSKR